LRFSVRVGVKIRLGFEFG